MSVLSMSVLRRTARLHGKRHDELLRILALHLLPNKEQPSQARRCACSFVVVDAMPTFLRRCLFRPVTTDWVMVPEPLVELKLLIDKFVALPVVITVVILFLLSAVLGVRAIGMQLDDSSGLRSSLIEPRTEARVRRRKGGLCNSYRQGPVRPFLRQHEDRNSIACETCIWR